MKTGMGDSANRDLWLSALVSNPQYIVLMSVLWDIKVAIMSAIKVVLIMAKKKNSALEDL